jgi:hypothetical protein
MRRLVLPLALLTALLLGCGYAKRIDPQLLTYPTENMRDLSAINHAIDIHGVVYSVADTHSMEPLIYGGDKIVVAPTPLTRIADGSVIVYRPDWAPVLLVVHRIVASDASGKLVSGDNVKPDIADNGRDQRTESRYRVTESNYMGEVVGIYRVKP